MTAEHADVAVEMLPVLVCHGRRPRLLQQHKRSGSALPDAQESGGRGFTHLWFDNLVSVILQTNRGRLEVTGPGGAGGAHRGH